MLARIRPYLLLTLVAGFYCPPIAASSLDLKTSCSLSTGSGAGKIIYSDQFRLLIQQQQVQEFYWESMRLRATHGHECSIDLNDGIALERINDGWRIALQDPAQARVKRGYDTARGTQCSLRLRLQGEEWHLQPTCPVLCGSRKNFSELYINPKTGQCRYEIDEQD